MRTKAWLVMAVLASMSAACGDDDSKAPAKQEAGDTNPAGKSETTSSSLANTQWVAPPEGDCRYVVYFESDLGYQLTYVCKGEPGVRHAMIARGLYSLEGTTVVGKPVSVTCPTLLLDAQHRFEREGEGFVLQYDEKALHFTRYTPPAKDDGAPKDEVQTGCLTPDGTFSAGDWITL